MRWWAAGWCLAFEKCFIGGEDVVWTGCDLLGIAVWSSSAKAKAEFFIRCSKLWWVCCDTCTHLLSWGNGRILKFYMNMGLRAVDSLWLNCCEHLESSPSMWVVRGHRYMAALAAGMPRLSYRGKGSQCSPALLSLLSICGQIHFWNPFL